MSFLWRNLFFLGPNSNEGTSWTGRYLGDGFKGTDRDVTRSTVNSCNGVEERVQ